MKTRGIVRRVSELLLAMVMVVSFSAMAHASLTVVGEGTLSSGNPAETTINGGYQLIYDSTLNVTWLDYSATPGNYWQNQVNWASNLVVTYNGINYGNGTNGTWILPTTVDASTSSGFVPTQAAASSSQIATLFNTELGNSHNASGNSLSNVGPFKNLTTANNYWSGTQVSYDGYAGQGDAWLFNLYSGAQSPGNETLNGYTALAVLQGNIVNDANPTPIPAAAYLFGSGLLGLVGIRKKMQA